MVNSSTHDVIITTSNGAGWDEYAMKHSESSFYHLYGWGASLESVFRLKKYYLEATKAGAICGVLPLVFVRTLAGKKMVSVPIGVYAGALSDDESVRERLIEKAVELTKELGCTYLELRNMKADKGLPAKDLYVTFIKPLPLKKEECLEGMPRKARAEVRHSIEKGLSHDTGLRYLDECYDIYAINQRYLGSPVVPKKWFTKLAETFKNSTDILIVKKDSRCIAAVLTFFYKDTVLPFYGGALPGYESYSPSNFMYLKLEEFGVEKGCKYFDFGRSRKNAGSYHFKIHQGFEPTQLYYQYYLNTAKKIPDISPSNKGFGAAKRIWKHMPLSLTKMLGPILYRYVMP